jgi:uncharacterized membrane protein YeiH
MKYSIVVRASALYDLIVTAPFAVPGVAPLLLGTLGSLNVSLGGSPFPPFGSEHLLFVNLMGSIVTVWAVLRLIRPRWEFGVADAVGRGLFSLHFALALGAGGHPLLWFLLVPEILWGLVQAVWASPVVRGVLCRYS